MSFPDHKILPADKSSWLSAAFEQKKIEFSPFKICSFYSELEVIQIQGEESKEYFFGNYYQGKYCGHIYFGDKYNQVQAAKICDVYMPPELSQLNEFAKKYGGVVWYCRYDPSQYAWIFDKILQKIN